MLHTPSVRRERFLGFCVLIAFWPREKWGKGFLHHFFSLTIFFRAAIMRKTLTMREEPTRTLVSQVSIPLQKISRRTLNAFSSSVGCRRGHYVTAVDLTRINIIFLY